MKTTWFFILAFFALMGCNSGDAVSQQNEAPFTELRKGEISTAVIGGTSAYNYEAANSGKVSVGDGFVAGTYTVADASGSAPSSVSPVKMPDKIIKTGNMGMEVDDYAKAMTDITAKIKAAQGYISHQSEQRDNYRISNTLTIRVASENFDAMMNGIGSTAKKLNYKNVYLQDVTEEYTDVTARLKTKREVEQRYLDILKSAKTIKDVLAVEEQLRVIREEIESSEARLKYLNDQVSYSTLTLEVYEELEYTAPAPLQAGFGHKLLTALTNGWNGLLASIIGLVHVWPFLLGGGIILLVAVQKFKRKRKMAMA